MIRKIVFTLYYVAFWLLGDTNKGSCEQYTIVNNTLTLFDRQILEMLGTLEEGRAARGKWLIQQFKDRGEIYSSGELTSHLKKLKRLGLVGFVSPGGDGYEIKSGCWYLVSAAISDQVYTSSDI